MWSESLKNETVVGVLIIILLLIGAYFFGVYEESRRKPEPITYIKEIHDTTFTTKTVEVPKYVYRNLPARLDTVYVESDTLEEARIDTILNLRDTLAITYWFAPLNTFDLALHSSPIFIRDTLIQTKIEVHTIPLEEQTTLADILKLGGAFLGGVLITKLLENK
jgi:hypothetical protein